MNKVIFLICAALSFVISAPVFAEEITIFSFEEDTQEWGVPDWCFSKEDCVAEREIMISDAYASDGNKSLEVTANFPGGNWTGAYIETLLSVTDWSQFSRISADIYLPNDTPEGLIARIILTTGEGWVWNEMGKPVKLKPGAWTTVKANLKPGSMDWKFFPDESFRHDVRKLGVRVESDKGPVYAGKLYIDNIKLIE